jgi:hypothetical protein
MMTIMMTWMGDSAVRCDVATMAAIFSRQLTHTQKRIKDKIHFRNNNETIRYFDAHFVHGLLFVDGCIFPPSSNNKQQASGANTRVWSYTKACEH